MPYTFPFPLLSASELPANTVKTAQKRSLQRRGRGKRHGTIALHLAK